MKMDHKTAAMLADAQVGSAWIVERHDGLAVGKGKRNFLAGALYDLAFEHHVGILASLNAGAVASAFALLRAQFETPSTWSMGSFVRDGRRSRKILCGRSAATCEDVS